MKKIFIVFALIFNMMSVCFSQNPDSLIVSTQVDTSMSVAATEDSVAVVYGSADEINWNEVLGIKDFEVLDGVSIVSFYRNDVN